MFFYRLKIIGGRWRHALIIIVLHTDLLFAIIFDGIMFTNNKNNKYKILLPVWQFYQKKKNLKKNKNNLYHKDIHSLNESVHFLFI